jgi:type VI secretion system ImpA family protein
MALDLETLLAPVSEEQPAGPDLSYSNERQQIEQAFESNEDGGEGEDRDWRTIIRLIEQQSGQTKDIWLPVYLARAGARSGSLDTVALGAQALAGLFETYWETVHPQLEELGLMGRKAPCDSLAARGEFLMPLERTVLVAHPRLGAFTGADLQRFRVEQEAADGYGMFRAALDDLGDAALEAAVAQLNTIEDGLRRADKVFTNEASGEPSPNYAPAYTLLASLKQALQSFMAGAPQTELAVEGAGDSPGGPGAPAASGPRISGRVDSRDDVIRALDAITDYYRRLEPSHPLQQLTQRARHWVTMDFLDLMQEIAPDATFQARQLLNKREE